MSGLLEQPTAVADSAPPEAPPATPAAPAAAPAAAPPEGQKGQLSIVVSNGLKLLHDKKVTDTVLKRISKATDQPRAIAESLVFLIEKLESSATANGSPIPLAMLSRVAQILFKDLLDLMAAAGMKVPPQKEQYRAFSFAVSIYLDNAVKSGKITKEQLAQMGEDLRNTPEGKKIESAAQETETMQAASPGPTAAPGLLEQRGGM